MNEFSRRLGLGSVIAISITAMLGSGIFVLPGLVAIKTGPSAWMAYLISALCVLPAALSKSELATAMPTSGGTYVYLNRTFGSLIGTIAGLGLCFSLLLKSSFALLGFGAYLSVMSSIPLKDTALVMLLGITLVNVFGVGKVSKSLVVLVSISILGLLLISFGGALNIETSYYKPFLKHGTFGLFSAAALVFVSFAGVTKVAAIAEEIKDPERNLPKGILLSLGIVTLIYCSVNFVLAGNIPTESLSGDLKPIYSLAHRLGGEIFGIGAAILGIVTMFSMANAGVLAASRFPFAMSRDHLLPGVFGVINKRFLTPIWSIVFSAFIVGFTIWFLEVENIVKLASVFMLIIYMSENLAVIILRESRVDWYKPSYKSPFYPWAQLFGIISSIVLTLSMASMILSAIVIVTVPGAVLYFFYSRKRTSAKGVIGIRGKRKDLLDSESEFVSPGFFQSFSMEEDAEVVVALFGKERSPEVLIEMGMALTQQGRLEVVHMTEVPEQIVLSDIGEETPIIRSLRRRIQAMSEKSEEPIKFDPILSHDIYKTVNDISLRLHCKWLVKEYGGRSRGNFTIHNPIGYMKDHLSCHLGTFRDAGVRYIRKIMVVVRDDDFDELVIKTADHLAKLNNAEITLVKSFPEIPSDEDVMKEKLALMEIASFCKSPTNSHILCGKTDLEAYVNASADFDLIVCEEERRSFSLFNFFGTQQDLLLARANCSILSIKPARHSSTLS
ncbi:MAG: amino acid permease [Bdellovibrionales bacterium]|nr:amino acid permease [Bdellovibrionales bacterium]